MSPPGPAGAGHNRAMRWGLWGCATLIIAVVALMAVVAAIAYLDFGEPDSAFPDRLAEAATAAGQGGRIALLPLAGDEADTIHLFAPGTTDAAAIEACLGSAWDKAALVAGHLADGMPGAFVVVADGEVVDYGWHLVRDVPLRFAAWPCDITAGDDAFVVGSQGEALVLTQVPRDDAAPD